MSGGLSPEEGEQNQLWGMELCWCPAGVTTGGVLWQGEWWWSCKWNDVVVMELQVDWCRWNDGGAVVVMVELQVEGGGAEVGGAGEMVMVELQWW